jgi:hypothetical protein
MRSAPASTPDAAALVAGALQCVRECILLLQEWERALQTALRRLRTESVAAAAAASTVAPAPAATGKGGKGGKGAAMGPMYLNEGMVPGWKLWIGDLHCNTGALGANQLVSRWLADANCHADDMNIRQAAAARRAGQYWGVLTWKYEEKCRAAYAVLQGKSTRDNNNDVQPLFVKYYVGIA